MEKIYSLETLFSCGPTFTPTPNPKTCPFCGSDAEVVSREFGNSRRPCFRVQCLANSYHSLDCWDDSEYEAITLWNQRFE